MNKNLLKEYIQIIIEQETETKKLYTVGDIKYTIDFFSLDDSKMTKLFKNIDKILKSKSSKAKMLKGAARVIISSQGGPLIDTGLEIAKIVKDTEKFKKLISSFKNKYKIKKQDSAEKKLADIYGVNDKPSLVGLPEKMSFLIDDKVEADFIVNFLKGEIENKPEDEELDIEELFKVYTAKKLDGYYVTK